MGSLEGTYDTRLHEAVRYGDIEDTKIALQQGYDPNLIGVYQWSALHEASHNGEIDILKLLLEKKGDPNRRDLLQGYTSVHYAAKEGHVDCLQLLMVHGGRYDVKDNNGHTSYDVATSECKLILDKQRVQDLMKLSPADAKKQILKKSDKNENKQSEDQDKLIKDVDASVTSETSDGSLTEEAKLPALGYIHLTFEHHSRKMTLKIRVWQISDLLLPPPNTSMINSIYIKSYLMPDKKKDSKRKTEEVKVESSEAHVKMSRSMEKGLGIQHVFSPSTYKFSKPLEYTDITKQVLKEKSVQIEVCITQKYSKRSFMIGMFHLPLKTAVKKLVREKYPLIPCLNHTIPANMKVYCASELQITNSARIFYSNPNVRNLSTSDISEVSDRAISDPDIQGVKVTEKIDRSPVKVDVCSDPDNENVSVVESCVVIPGEMETSDNSDKAKLDYDNLRIIDMSDSEDDTQDRKSAFKSVSKIVKSSNTEVSNISKTEQKHSEDHDVSVEMEEKMSPRYIEDWKYRDIKKKPHDQVSETDSRPQTPTWDYYDMTPTVAVDIPLDDFSPSIPQSPAPICLPMETTMSVRKNKKKTEKDSRSPKKEKRNSPKAIPGKAVPKIIITQDDEDGLESIQKSDRKKIECRSSLLDHAITPRNIALSIDLDENEAESVSHLHTVQVIADVHVDCQNSNTSPDTSIKIEDSDSFVIDLEDLENYDDISYSSTAADDGVNSQGRRSRSELVSKHTIPMQVFIDESVYDSCDEVSGYVDKFSPFTDNISGLRDQEVSEV